MISIVSFSFYFAASAVQDYLDCFAQDEALQYFVGKS